MALQRGGLGDELNSPDERLVQRYASRIFFAASSVIIISPNLPVTHSRTSL